MQLRRPGSRIIGSTAYDPERYGEKLIPLALKILRGEHVPPAVCLEHEFIPAAQETREAIPPFMRDDGLLFGYFETPESFRAALAGMRKEGINKKW